jgi:acyl carrier protein
MARTRREVIARGRCFAGVHNLGSNGDLMRNKAVQDQILRAIAAARQIPPDTIRLNSTFEELGIDSLDRLELLFKLETEFDIEIDDDDAKKVINVGEIVSGIIRLIEAKEVSIPEA